MSVQVALRFSPSEKLQLQQRADQKHLRLATMLAADIKKWYRLEADGTTTTQSRE